MANTIENFSTQTKTDFELTDLPETDGVLDSAEELLPALEMPWDEAGVQLEQSLDEGKVRAKLQTVSENPVDQKVRSVLNDPEVKGKAECLLENAPELVGNIGICAGSLATIETPVAPLSIVGAGFSCGAVVTTIGKCLSK